MSLRKKLDKLIQNRPKYQINQEAYDNQAIARNSAYGRDNAVVNAEAQVSQNASDALATAKNATASGAGILAAVSNINANTNQANQALAQQEAQTQAAGRDKLMSANAAMIEEKDKEWNFNVNDPYQNKVQALRERRKARQELAMKGLDTVGAIAGAAVAAGKTAATGGAA